MKDIIPAKKQSPILGLTGMGGGVGSNLGGSLAEKTYIDDVYSTQLYTGNNAARTINNGIDLAGKGGLVWTKSRSTGWWGPIVDTVRGKDYTLTSSSDGAQSQYATTSGNEGITSFNSNGYSLGADGSAGVFNYSSSLTYASWTFRKQKGFFDIVTFQQSGADSQSTPQVVPHNLGVAPGMILLKKLNGDRDWFVYHRDLGKDYWIKLNQNGVAVNENNSWGTTTPDANNFGYMSGYIGGGGGSAQFVAYLFGGGASTAAGAHSVYWPAASGQTRRIRCGDSSNKTADFNFGTGDLTIECWIKCSNSQGGYPRVVAIGPQWGNETNNLMWDHDETANRVSFYCYNHSSSTSAPLLKSSVKAFNGDEQYHHIAVTRNGDTWRLFVDGAMEDQQTWAGSPTTANSFCTIGNTEGTATTSWFGGYISNVRIVKGTAVYTSSFRPPTEPLTSVTNTKLLCCNNLSATAATVTPISLTEEAVMQNQTDNPFDDPDGFKFGEEGDQNIVKCGSYVGNGSNDGPEINLGWEPQYLLFKNSNGNNENWRIYDSMRGWVTGGNDLTLLPNTNDSEVTNQNFASITSTGFKVVSNDAAINTNGNKIIYMAIRRPDGYVAKPVESATEVFNMSRGSGTAYCHTAGFPVDFGTYRAWNSTQSWWNSNRLTQGFERTLHNGAADSVWAPMMFDSNTKWINTTQGASVQGWAWKRHAGFDVVTYTGNGTIGRQISHSLGRVPEMIWVKRRNATENWYVYHKGVNGGTNPADYMLYLNTADPKQDHDQAWNNSLPNSTHFILGNDTAVNSGGTTDYVAMLFASVDGISKCGYYTGNGQTLSNGTYLTTGFQPRYVFLKRTDGSGNWYVMDSLRGFGTAGQNTTNLYFNSDGTETGSTLIEVDTTGFRVVDDSPQVNGNGNKYIYYAHA